MNAHSHGECTVEPAMRVALEGELEGVGPAPLRLHIFIYTYTYIPIQRIDIDSIFIHI